MLEVKEFIESYRRTWEEVIGGREKVGALATFFNVPCMMLSVDGKLSQFDSVEQVREFNLSRFSIFSEGGAAKFDLRGVDVITQGDHAALAIVNWELHRDDGTVERAWRHYYSVIKSEDEWKIALTTFQVGS